MPGISGSAKAPSPFPFDAPRCGETEKSSLVNAGFHRRGAYQLLADASGAPSPWFEDG